MDKKLLNRLGIKIGHYTDTENLTGITAFIAEKGASIGIDIRGSGTCTFNTPSHDPTSAIEMVHGIVLTGGSAFGMESAFGVMQFLEEQKIGLKTPSAVVPNVTGAVIYDLEIGNSKVRPGKKDGYLAAKNASFNSSMHGNVGVGTGATLGKLFKGKAMKGGFGIGVTTLPQDILVAAFAVTNAIGDVINPVSGKFYAETGNYILKKKAIAEGLQLGGLHHSQTNTTLAVIATNVSLEKNQLIKIAQVAHDGMARAIFPVHTMWDGDVVFAISSHAGDQKLFSKKYLTTVTDIIGLAAQDALMKAIKNSL